MSTSYRIVVLERPRMGVSVSPLNTFQQLQLCCAARNDCELTPLQCSSIQTTMMRSLMRRQRAIVLLYLLDGGDLGQMMSSTSWFRQKDQTQQARDRS